MNKMLSLIIIIILLLLLLICTLYNKERSERKNIEKELLSPEMDVIDWKYENGQDITWEWRSFPKINTPDSLNTGQYVNPDIVFSNWDHKPGEIKIKYINENVWLIGESNMFDDWDWTPCLGRDIKSTMGLKIMKDIYGSNLLIQGKLCEPNTKLSICHFCDSWVGYFLEKSQHVNDAIPADVMDDLIFIQTWRWSMSRTTSDQQWIGKPDYTFNYGDLVVLKTETDTTFCWELPERNEEPVYRPMAEHYQYEEKSDYLPIYAVIDPDNPPQEIAIFIDGVCKGAEIVDADTTQICAYILDESPWQEIEFEFWYGSRKPAEKHKSYLVYDPDNMNVTQNSIITGMKEDFYLVSFYPKDEIPSSQIQMNCYPNPFNPELNIAFNVAEESKIKLNIYNIKGQKVKTLADELFRAGEYEIVWNGRNEQNRQTGSGIYFIGIHSGSKSLYHKVVMLK